MNKHELPAPDHLPITEDLLQKMASSYHFKIDDSRPISDKLIEWDLEFVDMIHAASFAQLMLSEGNPIQIRRDDFVESLYRSVVLTLVVDQS